MEADPLIDAWEAAWSGRDTAAFRRVCLGELHYEDPLTATPLLGLEKVEQRAQRLWRAFPDLRVESAGPRLSDEGHIAAPIRIVGTHRGAIAGIPATGRTVSLHAVCFCEVRHGLLARVRAFYDLSDAQVQLGAAPEPGSTGERAMRMILGFGLRAPKVPGLFPGTPRR
jgi:steroid delta-isomerase-like uncharacterized protein